MDQGLSLSSAAYDKISATVKKEGTDARTLFSIGPLKMPKFGFMQSSQDKRAIDIETNFTSSMMQLLKTLDEINDVVYRKYDLG